MKAIVGYTGFVGSNICAYRAFEGKYNSKNISDAYGTAPELLVYSGVRAEKFLANSAPEQDLRQIYEAEKNIKMISPEKLVLISTVDVFKDPRAVDERSQPTANGLSAYGANRLCLEQWVRENYPDALIIRLPALFGEGLKKNFLYDMLHPAPSMLKYDKYEQLYERDPFIGRFYHKSDNGFFKLDESGKQDRELAEHFKSLGFTSLLFTDSRSVYQFYPLRRLWGDINTALENKLTLWHPATEPVSAAEIYKFITGAEFKNEIAAEPAYYDLRTIYAELFGGNNGYVINRSDILDQICSFYYDKELK